ncbi:unnamed protein product [Rotaria magnacalcarata]|uniref:Mutator-like transposase domain-containing protein n=1 Tax=Rotaria magnacalcarata TaxID=392030 RepID=A0A819XYH1_9BILA|nr:unnamed protein product [Rotaria magnacalcarata]
MSSDESFFDEDLDIASSIDSSDRVLRSSSISSKSNRTISSDFNHEIYSHSRSSKETIVQTKNVSRSFQKIRLSIESASAHEIDERSSQIFDINYLKECMHSAHICPGGRLELIIDTEKNIGLFHKNGLKCSICKKTTDLTNFPSRPLHQLQEPNQRLYAASAISGIGYDATYFILSLLGINTPHRSNFYKQIHHLYDELFDFAHIDFLSLIDDIRRSKQCEPNDVLNLTVSLDGTWKKRGHQSMYGIVFLIEAELGYCLDFETLSKRCELCEVKQRILTASQFKKWYEMHQTTCSKTWDGSAGGMEKEGLRYTNMISDGDSSAYEAVKHTYVNALIKNLIRSGKFTNHSSMDSKDENINIFLSKLSSEQYENNLVTKEDCINHVKKRVSSHLKTLKSRYSGFENVREENLTSATEKNKHIQPVGKSRKRRRLADGKSYGGGAGRMTKAMEHKLADSYGIAIRQSSESAKNLDEDDAVKLIERRCRAAFLHNIKNSNGELQHGLCQTGPYSWCSYQKDKYVPLKQKIDPAKQIKRLDPIFLEILTPMIDTLTNPILLRRCLRGATQNANESINSVVWSILPKSKYHGYRSIRGAAAISSIFFNRGRSGLVKFFDQVGIPVTDELLGALLGKDYKRIEKAENNTQRHDIIKRRKEQQRIQGQIEEDEEMDYGAGIF